MVVVLVEEFDDEKLAPIEKEDCERGGAIEVAMELAAEFALVVVVAVVVGQHLGFGDPNDAIVVVEIVVDKPLG